MMNDRQINERLAALLAQSPQVQACALVEAASGLVWARAGALDTTEPLWEAATEYWRLHTRLAPHFGSLGPLGAAVLYHHHKLLVVMPCASEPELLLTCVATPKAVDWKAWRALALQLGTALSPQR